VTEGKGRDERGAGLFIWRGGLGDWQRWSWRSRRAVARMGGGVYVRVLGMRGEQVFLEGRGRPEVPRWSCQSIGHVCARRCSVVAEVV
jgi:hypothetical protein